ENFFRIFRDRVADTSDTGRVGHRKIGTSLQRHFRDHFDLAAEVHQERRIRDLQQLDAINIFNSLDDLIAVLTGDTADGDIADDVVVADGDDVDSADVAAGAADCSGQFT